MIALGRAYEVGQDALRAEEETLGHDAGWAVARVQRITDPPDRASATDLPLAIIPAEPKVRTANR
jgi:hypothetical protein